MRLKLFLAVLGILMSSGLPVQAQQQTGQPTGYNAGYQYQQQQFAPIYNNGTNVQPYYMNQQNTGYYNNNNNNLAPFSFNSGYNNNSSISGLTPDQAAYIRTQREAAAQLYQQQYMQQMQQQPPGATANQVGIYNQTNPYYPGQQQQKPPTKRKVVYNERNNPLSIPPRLFNPDQ